MDGNKKWVMLQYDIVHVMRGSDEQGTEDRMVGCNAMKECVMIEKEVQTVEVIHGSCRSYPPSCWHLHRCRFREDMSRRPM